MATTTPRKIILENFDESNKLKIEEDKEEGPNHKWDALNLKTNLVRGIFDMGFDTPSFIQKKAVPHIAQGRDMRAQAQSGTGKTGAFVIGALQRMDENLQTPQCLVLVSTREIALQIVKVFEKIGKHMGISACLLVGATPIHPDIEALSKNPQVVVGTPGRINHMIERGYFKVDDIKTFVLDEADEMLKEGFQEQVKEIYQKISSENMQSLLFSATYSEQDFDVIKNIIKNPVEIDLLHEDQTLKGIKQVYVDIGPSRAVGGSLLAKDKEVVLKVLTLMDIFKNHTLAQILVFINKKTHASLVHKTLNENEYPCELITSDLDQKQRTKVLEDFKAGKTRILVSSGLCKRGIDVQSLSMVVCLDVPSLDDKNDYIHRVGRSGRYGRKGVALHILNSQELENLQNIARSFDSIINPLTDDFDFKD